MANIPCRRRSLIYDYSLSDTDLVIFSGERTYFNNILTGITNECSVLGDGTSKISELPFLEIINIEIDTDISLEILQIEGNLVLIKNTDVSNINVNLGTTGVPIIFILTPGTMKFFKFVNGVWEDFPNQFDSVEVRNFLGVGTSTPSITFSVNEKIGFSTTGGMCIKLTNKTGAVSVKGKLLRASASFDNAVDLTGAGDVECMGVFLEDGIADGSEAWVVVSGIAEVLFDDNVGPTSGDWISTGAAGFAAADTSPAAAPAHFEEIGHCIQTVAAGGPGTNVYANCVLHFN